VVGEDVVDVADGRITPGGAAELVAQDHEVAQLPGEGPPMGVHRHEPAGVGMGEESS
jgi:hypothetical protein